MKEKKVIVSWQVMEEEPEFQFCGIVGFIVEETEDSVIIDFGKKKLTVKKKYVQNIRGERWS